MDEELNETEVKASAGI